MLTTAQVDHFRTFGFIVLRGYLPTAPPRCAPTARCDPRRLRRDL